MTIGWVVMIVSWIAVAALLVASLVLLSGKGAGIIAGYNSMSPTLKAKYDEKKVCKSAGVTLLAVTILSAAFLLFLHLVLLSHSKTGVLPIPKAVLALVIMLFVLGLLAIIVVRTIRGYRDCLK